MNCAVCTVVMQIFENYIKYKAANEADTLAKMCTILPAKFQATCNKFITLYGAAFIRYNLDIFNADYVCREIKMCTDRSCHINPLFAASDPLDTEIIHNTMN